MEPALACRRSTVRPPIRRLFADREPAGAGTSSSCAFRADRGRERRRAASGERARRLAPPSARGVVLVVEDQDEVRRQIVEVLGDLGCEVVEAADGLEALNIVESRRTRLDLLVTDVGFPGSMADSWPTRRREIRPDLPILLITGYAGARSTPSRSPRAQRSCASRSCWRNWPCASRRC